ncbi:hypothetical protein MMC14_007262 [Varicellaria rhodocarpa]|nr:hypothetical protein [Varicellaria rhodocarpa]
MSSRALRRLQREQEARQKNQAQSRESDGEDLGKDAEEATEIEPSLTKNLNAFDMLDMADEEEDHEDDDSGGASVTERQEDAENLSTSETNTVREGKADPAIPQNTRTTKSRQKKKNKKKKKQGAEGEASGVSTLPVKSAQVTSLDEIDAALLSLREKHGGQENNSHKETELNTNAKKFYTLLATDTKNLNSLNEMKRLFGSAVLGEADEAATPGPARRHGRGPQQLDLGEALAGRNSPVSRGQGLAGLALRRNVFMPGKEEWPKATSGGLSMEVVERAWDFTTEYRFVHNSVYQDVQKQFESCVESLDPQRMIQLLQFNRMRFLFSTFTKADSLIAYHMSTLLQVSEIAKQQGDHSVSGDLLERALFSFGRSVHSSFHTALTRGEARIDFRYRENREFFLASWRYIGNLGQRGTWRTAYEWAKLLLSFDPEGDPYEIRLILDQLALRGGQAQHFLDLATTKDWYQETWEDLPNIQISKALAQYKLKRPVESRGTLREAISSYPWIFSRMFQELNISPIPKAIWGKKPRSDRENLASEIYVVRAKDLWNTPEAMSLLVEVANSVNSTTNSDPDITPISLSEARHVLLAEIPTLISLLPRTYTSMRTSAADPLPPPDDIPPYITQPSDLDEPLYHSPASMPREPEEVADEAQELRGAQSIFSRLIPWLGMRGTRNVSDENSEPNEEVQRIEEFVQAVNNAGGIPPEVIGEQGARMHALQEDLLQELRQREQAYHDQNPHTRALEEEAGRGISPDTWDNLASAIEANARPHVGLSSSSQDEPSSHQGNDSDIAAPVSDDERNQRWLVGQGMQRLKNFTNEYGTHENVWLNNSSIDVSPVDEYVRRIRLLQSRATKNVILEHHLQQGAGSKVRDLIKRRINHG